MQFQFNYTILSFFFESWSINLNDKCCTLRLKKTDQAGLLRKGLKVIFSGLLIVCLSDFAFRFSDL